MNFYGQILSITLGGLLSISEILPFVRNVKTNGILHFLLSSLITDAIEYEQQNEDEFFLTQNQLSTDNDDSCTRQDTDLHEHAILSDLESQPLLHSHKKKPKKETDLQYEYQDDSNNIKYDESLKELQNDVTDIKKELCDENIKTNLNVILTELKNLKQDKESHYSSKNVEDIVEMILQHLRDLQRTQSQWVDNYGENNLKNDIKFENMINQINTVKNIFYEITDSILEKIHKLKELIYDSAEYQQDESNNINANVISKELIHQTIHEFFENKHLITNTTSLDTDKLIVDVSSSLKQHLELQIAEINNNFIKQSLLIDGLTLQCSHLGDKLNELTIKLSDNLEKTEKKKKKSNFLIGGKDL